MQVHQVHALYKDLEHQLRQQDRAEEKTDQQPVEASTLRRVDVITNTPIELASADLIGLRSSKVHGRGVFATRFIPKGTLVTMYPAHVVLFAQNADVSVAWPGAQFKEAFGQHDWEDAARNLDDYIFCFSKHRILAHPSLDRDPKFFGHFINDGASIESLDGIRADPNGSYIGRPIEYYKKLSFKRQNVKFVKFGELACGIEASKNIEPGTELLATYSVQYWIIKTSAGNSGK
jgi:hypothetical protein